MGNIQQRGGGVHIRLGGNTQDFAVYVEELENGHALDKETKDAKNPVRCYPSFIATLTNRSGL